jgi:hypothetical protein
MDYYSDDENRITILRDQCFEACLNNDSSYLRMNTDEILSSSYSPFEFMVGIITSQHDDFSSWDLIFPLVSRKDRVTGIRDDKTLLMHCCDTEDPCKREKLKRLLDGGCDASITYQGKIALSFLVKTNDVELIQWFMSYSPTSNSIYSRLPLLFEMFYPKDEMEVIQDEWEMNEFEERQMELQAERYYDFYDRRLPFDNIDTLQFFLEEFKTHHFIDNQFQMFTRDGESLLTIACREGVHDKIKLLLEFGIDPESVPEINFKSRMVLLEVQDEIKRDEKKKWTFLLTYMTGEGKNDNKNEQFRSQDLIDSLEMVQQLGMIHRETLFGMIFPFL